MKFSGTIIASLIVIFNCFTLFSQPSLSAVPSAGSIRDGSIKGKIMDSGVSKPMEFTSVALYNAIDSSLVTGTISGSDGAFVIKNLAVGEYYLVAAFMGYEKQVVEEIIVTDGNLHADIGVIKLMAATQKLDEIEVVATQNRVEYKIDRKVINVSQDLNAAGGTAADVLQNTPSVTVDIDGNVSLRGSSNFTVLIDGRPTPLSGNDALQQIPATSIQNIEIITNPSAKYEPDGMAGIINIVMKKNSLQGFSGIINSTIGTGDKYSGDFLLSYKGKKINVFGGFNYQDNSSDGSVSSLREMNPDSSLSSLVYIDGFRGSSRKGYVAKTGLDIYLTEKSTLSLSADMGNRGGSELSRSKMHSYTNPASYDKYDISNGISNRGGDYFSLDANYSVKFDKPGHEIVAALSYQGELDKDTEEESEYPANENYVLSEGPNTRIRSNESGREKEWRLNFDYVQPVFENGKIESGYQMRLDNENENYLFENYDPDTDNWINDPIYSSGNYYKSNIQALYGTYSDKLGKFEYKLGLRSEYTNRSIREEVDSDAYSLNLLDFFPSFHISRQLKSEQQVLASYSRRINRPRGHDLEPFRSYMNSYTLREGNPELEPEYVNSVELSYQKSFGKSFFVLESYYRNTQNLITRFVYQDPTLPNVVIMTNKNINSDNSLGAEMMLNLMANRWFNLNTSFNVYKYWLDGIIDGELVTKNSNNWDTRVNASFYLSTKSRIQANFMYNGPSVTAQGDRGAFYFASMAYRQDFLDRKLSATLSVQDIFATMKYQFSTYSPSLNSKVKFEREHQVITLTLSYKINNFKSSDKESNGSQMMMDEGSGEF